MPGSFGSEPGMFVSTYQSLRPLVYCSQDWLTLVYQDLLGFFFSVFWEKSTERKKEKKIFELQEGKHCQIMLDISWDKKWFKTLGGFEKKINIGDFSKSFSLSQTHIVSLTFFSLSLSVSLSLPHGMVIYLSPSFSLSLSHRLSPTLNVSFSYALPFSLMFLFLFLFRPLSLSLSFYIYFSLSLCLSFSLSFSLSSHWDRFQWEIFRLKYLIFGRI